MEGDVLFDRQAQLLSSAGDSKSSARKTSAKVPSPSVEISRYLPLKMRSCDCE